MINVLATIEVKPGCRDKFIEIFKANVPNVRAEDGCIDYFPAIDVPTGLPPQTMNDNAVTVIEKWADLAALRAHLEAPHMATYREQVKDLVDNVSLKVLEEA